MKVISPTGYSFTGSSAVTDLVNEYENVCSNSDFEVTFLYGRHGVDYLYHFLIEAPDDHISNLVIQDFLDYCKFLSKYGTKENYEIFFHNSFIKYTREYIEQVGKKSYIIRNIAELERKAYLFQVLFRILNKIYHIIRKNTYKNINILKPTPFYFHCLDEETFVNITKKYLNNLLSVFYSEGKDTVVIDRLLPYSHIDRYIRYFDDAKVIVVDRDPRDIFLGQKYVWKTDKIPESVELFCEWFVWYRSLQIKEDKKYLHIWFEDMVFRYEDTKNKIEEYCGLDPTRHKNKGKRFDPRISRRNCRLWEIYKDDVSDITYIEQNLSRYLYNYDELLRTTKSLSLLNQKDSILKRRF